MGWSRAKEKQREGKDFMKSAKKKEKNMPTYDKEQSIIYFYV